MIDALKNAPLLMNDGAKSVSKFLLSCRTDDGGFHSRDSRSDLYYTFFASEALSALNIDFDKKTFKSYLNQFIAEKPKDMVHFSALIRCLANFFPKTLLSLKDQFSLHLLSFKAKDYAFANFPNSSSATAYATFLAVGAHQDLNIPLKNKKQIINTILNLKNSDHGFANDKIFQVSTTAATAAALMTLKALNAKTQSPSLDWLKQRLTKKGGFEPAPNINLPDILSTAAAVHTLTCYGLDLSDQTKKISDFVNKLQTKKGGFIGSENDSLPDCEYTYYAMLILTDLQKK